MALYLVAAAYAIWLTAMNVVFYRIQGNDIDVQEISVLAGALPMALQALLVGFDPLGMLSAARMMGLFILIVLLGYLFNGADWTSVTYVVELFYISALTILVAGSPDPRLLTAIAAIYTVPMACFLIYIDIYGDYVWGRLVAGNLESNAWGLMAASVGVAAFAHRSRILGALGLAAAFLTIYDASSRSSLVGLVLGAALIGVRQLLALRNHRLIAAFGGIAVAMCLAVVLVPWLREALPFVLDDLLKLDDPLRGLGKGATGREELWRAALELWWNHPWFGVGFRMHEAFMPGNLSAHNAYLAMLADTGFFGFLWFVLLMAAAWIGSFRVRDPATRRFAIGVIAAYTIIGLFERRAINGANPMGFFFLMVCFAIFRDRALARLGRGAERLRPGWQDGPGRALAGAGGEAPS